MQRPFWWESEKRHETIGLSAGKKPQERVRLVRIHPRPPKRPA
nr:MAG TPA: hypothetical protein [Caudoviricetes sp.]